MVPTLLLFRFEINVLLAYPLVVATGVPPVVCPKNLSRIGSGTQAAQGEAAVLGAKLVPPRATRFFCAFRNSCRKPFSKILTSLMVYARHALGDMLPTYRASKAVS